MVERMTLYCSWLFKQCFSQLGCEFVRRVMACLYLFSTINIAGIKIAGRNINNLRHAVDTTLMAEIKGELKSLLKVKEESEKVGLKLNIQKT